MAFKVSPWGTCDGYNRTYKFNYQWYYDKISENNFE